MEDIPKLRRTMLTPVSQVNPADRPQILAPAFREPSPPEPFKFQAGNGLWLNVHPEKRGRNWYWFANKQLNGHRHRLYVAPAGLLTRSLLENAAKHIAG